MQYIRFIQANFKQHQIEIINISKGIKKIEKDESAFQEIISKVEQSDGVIWAFPVYVFTVHSNYQRFIELIFERSAGAAFKGKYTFVLTTSIHFFDSTAINYVHSICDDLNMNYVDYFSPKMYDLTKEETRKGLLNFMQNYIEVIENRVSTFRSFNPVVYSPIQYVPETCQNIIDNADKKVVIVADYLENSNLKNMVNRFIASFAGNAELIYLKDFGIKGSCLGCMKCGYDYKCAYEGKDNYSSVYNSKLKTADIIVFAGTIKNRYLSSEWKQFLDRGFFNTHTPSLIGKQFGFIISGALNHNQNMREVFEGFVQWQHSNLVGFVTDEYNSSREIDNRIDALGFNLVKLSLKKYIKPVNFLGAGGMTIFRDNIWGEIRFPFIADHKAYKKMQVYDFPQKNIKVRVQNAIFSLMIKIPSFRKEIYQNQIIPSMVTPFKKYIN
jgi:multimeric flavodoxin WrbA